MRDLDEATITDAVIGTFSPDTEPRFRAVMEALVRHLHAFAMEIELKPEEWEAGIDFLFRSGKISTPERNEFVLISDILGLSSLIDILKNRHVHGATEHSVLGPFFIDGLPASPVGCDMISAPPGENDGEPVLVEGRVIDQDGEPVAGASVDVWQNATNGLYDVQDDALSNYNLRCRMVTGADGVYRFTTVRPQPYMVPTDGPVGGLLEAVGRHPWRPAHFHFKIGAPGYATLITELFPHDSAYIDEDAVFGVRQSIVIEMGEESDKAACAGTARSLEPPFKHVSYDFTLTRASD